MKKIKKTKKLPKSVQSTIPIQIISDDGLFQIEPNKYSCIWKFDDVNYQTEDEEQQTRILRSYGELLNKIDETLQIQITLSNRYINPVEYEENILLKQKEDNLNSFRKEMNTIILDEASNTNNLVRERYICLTTTQKNFEEAKKVFSYANLELANSFTEIGAKCLLISTNERMKIYHSFFRAGEEKHFNFDFETAIKQGINFKDYIVPDFLTEHLDYINIGTRFCRVLFMNEYANSIRDKIISDLMDRKQNLILSIHVDVLSKDKGRKFVQSKMDAIESNIEKWIDNRTKKYKDSSNIPYNLRKQRENIQAYMDEITQNDQRYMFITLLVAITADSKEELDAFTKDIIGTARGHSCDLRRLFLQQQEGLNTTLPYGHKLVSVKRSMFTDTVSLLHPFETKELADKNGIWKGHHPNTLKQIFVNRKLLLNGNGFYLGKSGAGKSFALKLEVFLTALSTEDDIIIVDVDREYTELVEKLGGEVIQFSPHSSHYINAMELIGEQSLTEQIKKKSDFIQSICEQTNSSSLESSDRSIIDRCVTNVFNRYFDAIKAGDNPDKILLIHFYNELLAQKERRAHNLALGLEIFVTGSLDIFSKETNIDQKKRLICYDIHEIGNSLAGLGLLVILDFINAKMTENRIQQKFTHIFLDEVQNFFLYESGAKYLQYSWQHARKMGGLLTGATQNATPILNSEIGSIMLANSEYLLLLAQHQTDLVNLIPILNLSENETRHLETSKVGKGLVKAGSDLIPFENEFPKNSSIYRMLDTSPGKDKE